MKEHQKFAGKTRSPRLCLLPLRATGPSKSLGYKSEPYGVTTSVTSSMKRVTIILKNICRYIYIYIWERPLPRPTFVNISALIKHRCSHYEGGSLENPFQLFTNT